jgi:hypothetical protein
MYDAFISYSRSDLPAVRDLMRKLDERRLRVFLDLERLRLGRDWPPQLGGAVQGSRMMVLCWSEQAATSDWVKAEIHHSLSTKKPVPVLPWLLDSTPLPAMLRQRQGIQGTDTARVVDAIADERRRHRRRAAVTWVASAVIVAPALWWSPRVLTRQSITFRGHVMDERGNAVAGATVEAGGLRGGTNPSGEFALVLPGPPSRRALRVTVWKPGYRRSTKETQADVPDLGVVLERER